MLAAIQSRASCCGVPARKTHPDPDPSLRARAAPFSRKAPPATPHSGRSPARTHAKLPGIHVEAPMGEPRPPPDPVNLRYLERLARKDWLRNLQTAYFMHRVALHHARAKSHFVRYFGVASRNVHFIEQTARALLDESIVNAAEAELLARIDASMREIDRDTARAHALLQAEGVTALPEYVQAPLEVDAKCTSPKLTRYLELIVKVDRLATLLEALRLAGTLGTNAYDRQVAVAIKRLVAVPRAALQIAAGLRKRLPQQSAPAAGGTASSSTSTPKPAVMEGLSAAGADAPHGADAPARATEGA